MLNHPVIYVTQADARNFCLWLTRKEQQEGSLAHNETYTLPTLDQWVTLARGAPLTADAVIERRWIVGQYQPTEPVTWGSPHSYLGCYHVFGNVFEWCLDEWARQLRRPDKTVEVPYYLAVGGGWRSTGNGWKSHFGDRTTVPFGARMAGSCKTADSESGCWCGNEVASEWPTAATGKPSTSSSH
jgi:formylglycine-generating enzyme required for sulfatase activity